MIFTDPESHAPNCAGTSAWTRADAASSALERLHAHLGVLSVSMDIGQWPDAANSLEAIQGLAAQLLEHVQDMMEG